MKISRFFQDDDFNIGQEYDLNPANHRHAIQVLRLKLGESLIVFNGRGGEYLATLVIAEKRKSRILIHSFDSVNRESQLKITLVLAMIKSDKMDFSIQKAIELGVSAIQPVYTKRSVIKIKENRLDKKMQHWEAVCISACEQSGRTKLPIVEVPEDIEQFINKPSSDFTITMLPSAQRKIDDLEGIDSCAQGISLFIGPEGGFTPDEEKLMSQAGLTGISFGPRILRAETAAIAAITACQQRWGDL